MSNIKEKFYLGDDTDKVRIHKIATQLCRWQIQASTADIEVLITNY